MTANLTYFLFSVFFEHFIFREQTPPPPASPLWASCMFTYYDIHLPNPGGHYNTQKTTALCLRTDNMPQPRISTLIVDIAIHIIILICIYASIRLTWVVYVKYLDFIADYNIVMVFILTLDITLCIYTVREPNVV